MSLDNSVLERFKREQAERWQAFMQRWDLEVLGHERQGWDAQKIGADFGKLGLQSALLINGGALVAIPPLMQWLTGVNRDLVAAIAIWFFVGMLCAGAAVVLAYINFMALSRGSYAFAQQRGIELNAEFEGKSYADNPQHTAAKKVWKRFSNTTTITAWIALILAIGSFTCFALGTFKFIDLAARSPAANATQIPSIGHK